jgi:hypothetical protein
VASKLRDLVARTEERSASSSSDLLRAKVALVIPALVAASRKLLDHPGVAELYPEYLIAFHGVVRASVPLMEAALRRAEDLAAGDDVAAGLVPYLRSHIPEETGHDDWVLEDLERLGMDRATVLGRTPSPTVAELVGAQYYWILHHHPVVLLGYMTLLEGYPPTAGDVEDLIARTGFDRAAFRTLLHHADADPHHAAELFETMDALPLTTEQVSALGVGALSAAYQLTRLIEEIVDRPLSVA